MTPGHVDPEIAASVPASNRRLLQLLRAVQGRAGYSLRRHGRGHAVHLSGPGISVVVSELAALSLADLRPRD